MAGYEAVGKTKMVWGETTGTPGDRKLYFLSFTDKKISENDRTSKRKQPHLLNRLNEIMRNETGI